VSTGYPSSEFSVGAVIATVAPVFAEPADIVWPVALVGA